MLEIVWQRKPIETSEHTTGSLRRPIHLVCGETCWGILDFDCSIVFLQMICDCNVDGNHNYFHSDHNSRARIDFGCNQSLADYHDGCLMTVQMTIVALFG